MCFLSVPAAVQAKFGMSKTWITFMMHHPPAFVTPGREVRTEVSAVSPENASLANQFKGQFEQSLITENFKPTPGAQTVVQFALNDIAASVQRQSSVKSVYAHVRFRTEYDKKGNPYQVEDCNSVQGEVTTLDSSGSLGATLQVTDTKTGAALLTRVLNPAYNVRSEIAGPQKCAGGTYGMAAGQLQDPQSIRRHLIETAVRETLRATAGFDEARRAMLTVDDPLKPGNAYALSGNWKQALETWTGASIKSNDKDKEAARQYNVGLSHEALAATAMKENALDEANAHLNDAEKCYSTALSLDPGEKYFREILMRLQHDRATLKEEQQHQFMKEAATFAAAPPPDTPAAPVTVNIPLEGWPAGEAEAVHDFRVYVRTRVTAQKEEPGDAFRQKLTASAADYAVKEGVAMQVVDSEVKRILVLKQNSAKYEEDFRDAAADGVISSDERAMLSKRQKILALPDAQVKEVEARFSAK
jgi:tetratricopeptide (TPR) repeat protein